MGKGGCIFWFGDIEPRRFYIHRYKLALEIYTLNIKQPCQNKLGYTQDCQRTLGCYFLQFSPSGTVHIWYGKLFFKSHIGQTAAQPHFIWSLCGIFA